MTGSSVHREGRRRRAPCRGPCGTCCSACWQALSARKWCSRRRRRRWRCWRLGSASVWRARRDLTKTKQTGAVLRADTHSQYGAKRRNSLVFSFQLTDRAASERVELDPPSNAQRVYPIPLHANCHCGSWKPPLKLTAHYSTGDCHTLHKLSARLL